MDVHFNTVTWWTARVDVGARTDNSAGGGGRGAKTDDATLPDVYGSDKLELMVRGPTSAHAYWEISVDRVKEAGGGPGGRKTFLRLIEVSRGHLLAEQEVSPERGSHNFALPLPNGDSAYVVELAIMRDYQWVVLARSNVIHAPSTTPTAATPPAFVTHPEQARALAEGGALRPVGEGDELVPPPLGVGPQAGPTAGGQRRVGAPSSAASEARPRGVGSEFRLAPRGSELRLSRREALHIPFVIARTPGIPRQVTAALNVLAAAVWSGRDPIHVLAAGNALASALADAGISFGPAIAILDPPGSDITAADLGAADPAGSDADRYMVTHSLDGSITVVGPDGSSIAYSPVQLPMPDRRTTRSAAAIIRTRHTP
jgi:hypothetical protein